MTSPGEAGPGQAGQAERRASRAAARAAAKPQEGLTALAALADDTAPPLTPEVARARLAVAEARGDLGRDLDGLTASAQAALDIPAKIRRDPIKTVALAGGAGFLLLGGPRRIVRATANRLFPRRRDPNEGLLPDEIERILRDSGAADVPGVREALAADFGEFLRRKGKVKPQPSGRASFWRTYDALLGPVGVVGARILVERLFAVGRGASPASGSRWHGREGKKGP